MRCVQLKNGSKFAQVPLAKTEKEIQREREGTEKVLVTPQCALLGTHLASCEIY